MLRYARHLVGDDETARDVVQEAFARLCAAGPEEVGGHTAPWLFTVCRNLAFDERRKERRMILVSETSWAEDRPAGDPSSPVAQLEARQLAGSIASALDALPEKQQEVVRLKFSAGLSYKEIAEVTGLSVSYVGVLIHAGMTTLRAQLAGSSRATSARRTAGGAR